MNDCPVALSQHWYTFLQHDSVLDLLVTRFISIFLTCHLLWFEIFWPCESMCTCSSPSKHRTFRALVVPILDYASTVWNPNTQKNIFALENYKIRVLAGFMEADFSHAHSNGLNFLKNVVENYSGHHCTLDENTCQYAAPKSLHSLSFLCKQSSINLYRYSFLVNAIFMWKSIPFNILSVSHDVTFRRLLYNFFCSSSFYFYACIYICICIYIPLYFILRV